MANKMKCEYCQNQPEYICDCCIIFCQPHIPKHREECQKFKIGVIKESDKVRILSIILFRRIQKINQISWEIVQNTQNLISTIENLCKNSVSKLESIKQKYQKIVEKGDLNEIEAETKIITEEKKILTQTQYQFSTIINKNFMEIKHQKLLKNRILQLTFNSTAIPIQFGHAQ